MERHKAGTVFIVPKLLCQKISVWTRSNMKEPLAAPDGYQVINLQDEHTLRHKHYISMLNAIMNEEVRSSYLYLVIVCSRKRCTFVVNGILNDATYWRSFVSWYLSVYIFSCILQNWYEKLDEAYINGNLRQVMLIGTSKCSN